MIEGKNVDFSIAQSLSRQIAQLFFTSVRIFPFGTKIDII